MPVVPHLSHTSNARENAPPGQSELGAGGEVLGGEPVVGVPEVPPVEYQTPGGLWQ